MALWSRLGGISVAMANRNYRLYTYGATPSLLGTWIQRMAVGWYAWELTESGFWLGLVAFADLAPAVVIAPIAGAFADRMDRLKMVRFVQYANMCQAIALATLTLSGMMTIELLCALALFQGSMQGIHQPFRQSMIGSIVTRAEMTSAIGINSTIWNTSRLIGPAISAAIILNFGVGVTFIVNAVSFVPMLITLHMIEIEPPPPSMKSLAAVPAEIMEGIRYVSGHGFIGPLLVLVFAFSFFGRATAELLPAYSDAIFGFGPEGLAVLTGAAGLGSLVSGFWLSRRGRLSGLGEILLVNMALLAVFQTLFSGSDLLLRSAEKFTVTLPLVSLSFAASIDLLMGALLIVLWGFTLNGCGIVAQSLIQANVPNSIRGRVVSLYGMLWLGTPAVGAFAMGAAADVVGFRWPVASAAAVIIVLCLWGLMRLPRLRDEIARMSEPGD
jgi:MFS family permease